MSLVEFAGSGLLDIVLLLLVAATDIDGGLEHEVGEGQVPVVVGGQFHLIDGLVVVHDGVFVLSAVFVDIE